MADLSQLIATQRNKIIGYCFAIRYPPKNTHYTSRISYCNSFRPTNRDNRNRRRNATSSEYIRRSHIWSCRWYTDTRTRPIRPYSGWNRRISRYYWRNGFGRTRNIPLCIVVSLHKLKENYRGIKHFRIERVSRVYNDSKSTLPQYIGSSSDLSKQWYVPSQVMSYGMQPFSEHRNWSDVQLEEEVTFDWTFKHRNPLSVGRLPSLQLHTTEPAAFKLQISSQPPFKILHLFLIPLQIGRTSNITLYNFSFFNTI